MSLQLVLLICKLQPLIAQLEYTFNGSDDDGFPMTRKVFGNGMYKSRRIFFFCFLRMHSKYLLHPFSIVIVQLLILIEVVLLSIWSHHLYRAPSKNDGGEQKSETASS